MSTIAFVLCCLSGTLTGRMLVFLWRTRVSGAWHFSVFHWAFTNYARASGVEPCACCFFESRIWLLFRLFGALLFAVFGRPHYLDAPLPIAVVHPPADLDDSEDPHHG